MKFHHPFRRNASHRPAFDHPGPRQGTGGIHLAFFGRAVQSVSLIVGHDDVDIDLFSVFIAQDKIPGFGILQLYIPIPTRLQEPAQHWDILLLNGYVQVFMKAGLLAKQCVDAPSAIDPDFDACLVKGRIQMNHVSGVHAVLLPVQAAIRSYLRDEPPERRVPQVPIFGTWVLGFPAGGAELIR